MNGPTAPVRAPLSRLCSTGPTPLGRGRRCREVDRELSARLGPIVPSIHVAHYSTIGGNWCDHKSLFLITVAFGFRRFPPARADVVTVWNEAAAQPHVRRS